MQLRQTWTMESTVVGIYKASAWTVPAQYGKRRPDRGMELQGGATKQKWLARGERRRMVNPVWQCLDDPNFTRRRAPVDMWTWNGGSNQQWLGALTAVAAPGKWRCRTGAQGPSMNHIHPVTPPGGTGHRTWWCRGVHRGASEQQGRPGDGVRGLRCRACQRRRASRSQYAHVVAVIRCRRASASAYRSSTARPARSRPPISPPANPHIDSRVDCSANSSALGR